MTTLQTTQEIINICTESTYMYRQGNFNCFYVYIHYVNNIPFYIGQGSHNRAYKSSGRSKDWNLIYEMDNDIKIKIIKNNLSFEESLKLEKELINKHSLTIINKEYGHSPNETQVILCFNKQKELIKRYANHKELEKDGFNPKSVVVNCNPNQKRSTYKSFIWCYEKDYNKRKDTLFILGKTCNKSVQVTFPNGIVKVYPSINSTKDDGLLPSKVREVLEGTRKSHKGCSYKYIL